MRSKSPFNFYDFFLVLIGTYGHQFFIGVHALLVLVGANVFAFACVSAVLYCLYARKTKEGK